MTNVTTIQSIADADVKSLSDAQKRYGDAWCKRGGISVFTKLADKWDKIQDYLTKPPKSDEAFYNGPSFAPYDVFGAVYETKAVNGVIDDIRDLRRYLMLIEAYCTDCGLTHKGAMPASAAPTAYEMSDVKAGSTIHDTLKPTDDRRYQEEYINDDGESISSLMKLLNSAIGDAERSGRHIPHVWEEVAGYAVDIYDVARKAGKGSRKKAATNA